MNIHERMRLATLLYKRGLAEGREAEARKEKDPGGEGLAYFAETCSKWGGAQMLLKLAREIADPGWELPDEEFNEKGIPKFLAERVGLVEMPAKEGVGAKESGKGT